MTDVDDFLAHFGVKGMRWGVTTSVAGRNNLADLRNNPTPVSIYSKNSASESDRVKTAKLTAEVMSPNGNITKLNQDYLDRGVTPNRDTKTMGEYDQQAGLAMTAHAKSVLPKGADARVLVLKDSFELVVGTPGAVQKISSSVLKESKKEAKHSDVETASQLTLVPIRDSKGLIIRFEPKEDSMTHNTLDALLAEHGGQALSHIAVAGNTSNDGKSGGGGKFDEGKVKRDGRGQFSTKASSLDKKDLSKKEFRKLLDGAWEKNLNDTAAEVMFANIKAVKGLMRTVADGFGLAKLSDLEQKHFTAKTTAPFVDFVNANMSKNGVSSSGTQKAEAYFNHQKGEVYTRAVDYNGPNPHPAVTQKALSGASSNKPFAKKPLKHADISEDEDEVFKKLLKMLLPSLVTESLTHAAKTESIVNDILSGLESKYGAGFLKRPLMDMVKERPASEQKKLMKSLVRDVTNLKVFLSKKAAHSELAHFGGLDKVWSEAKVARDGVGQFAKSASSTLSDLAGDAGDQAAKGVNSVENFKEWLGDQFKIRKTTKTTEVVTPEPYPDMPSPYYSTYREPVNSLRRIAGESYPVAPETTSIVELIPDPAVIAYEAKVRNTKLFQDEAVGEFLSHFGIKGMKWGVTRVNPSGVTPASASSSTAKSGTDSANGSSSGGKISEDAVRLIQTTQKPGTAHMSDQEIREAVNRAKMVEEYNKIFNSTDSKQLKETVDQLELQKKYSQMKAEMNPSRSAKVKGLVKSSAAAYISYKNLDKASDGALGSKIGAVFGTKSGGKHRAGK